MYGRSTVPSESCFSRQKCYIDYPAKLFFSCTEMIYFFLSLEEKTIFGKTQREISSLLNRDEINVLRVYTTIVAIQCKLTLLITNVSLHYVAKTIVPYDVMWPSG